MEKRNSVIIDTGFFIALNESNDPMHHAAIKSAKKYHDRDWVTTWPVLTELSHLISQHQFKLLLQDQIKGFFKIFSLMEIDVGLISELWEKYQDLNIDLADLSLIILAQSLNNGDLLTCDLRDFSVLRWNKNKPFRNLLLS